MGFISILLSSIYNLTEDVSNGGFGGHVILDTSRLVLGAYSIKDLNCTHPVFHLQNPLNSFYSSGNPGGDAPSTTAP